MGRTYTDTFTFEYSWENLTRAVFEKYPNPFASHVLASDVVDRWVDEKTGVLHTVRLFLKTNSLPKWAKSVFPYALETYIIELSSVDPKAKEMRTRTFNLTHTKTMQVEETQVFRSLALNPIAQVPSNNLQLPTFSTVVETEAVFTSAAGSGVGAHWLRNRIESFGVSRFESNTAKSRRGLLHVLSQIAGPAPSTLQNTKEPVLSRTLSVTDTFLDRTKKIAAVTMGNGTHPVGLAGSPALATVGSAVVVGGVGALVAVVGMAVWTVVKFAKNFG